MAPIRVLVHGALGKMGEAAINAVCVDDELELVGAVDVRADQPQLDVRTTKSTVPFSSNLESLASTIKADVMVDFTQRDATMPAIRIAAKRKINIVIGTSGLSETEMVEIKSLCEENQIGAAVVPNFSLGAVLMMYLSKIAARYFDYAEIVEMHHEQKLDSPSGTAIATARGMVESHGKPFVYPATEKESITGGRGAAYEGIALHSMRSPGFMAHQEVILGGPGQTLKIRHDQINRDAFGPGITLAIKDVVKSKGLTFGLERLLGLQE